MKKPASAGFFMAGNSVQKVPLRSAPHFARQPSGGAGVFGRGVSGWLGAPFVGQKIVTPLHHQRVSLVDALPPGAVFAEHAYTAEDVACFAKAAFTWVVSTLIHRSVRLQVESGG